MEDKVKNGITLENVRRWLGAILLVALIIIEAIICAQYYDSAGIDDGEYWMYIMLVLSCIILDTSVALKYYAITKRPIKFVSYGIDFFMLLIISVITGNSFIVVLYCMVTTEIYFSNESFKINIAVCGISAVMFVASFVLGWVRIYQGESLYTSVVEILGGCLLGVLILAIHFSLSMLFMRFYRMSKKLSDALKDADESRAELKAAYEKLSETAVYEERNRIAKDIHDNAGHSITTVIMQTEAAKLLIDSDPAEAKSKIIAANMQAKNALDQMRSSVHLLAGRDSAASVKDSLEEIIAQSMDATDLKIMSEIEDIVVDEEKARFLCNSVKECISNGIRHGGATAFYIELKKRKDEVSLLVSDNGCGAGNNYSEGYGLKSMREKAEEFGGSIRTSAETGEGFEVEIYFSDKRANFKDA